MIDLSIIILTHRNLRLKYGCLEHVVLSLSNQVDVNIELIVVNNFGDDEDLAFIQNILLECPIPSSVVNCKTGIAEGRNAGATMASSNVLVFLDDDCILMDATSLSKITAYSQVASHGYGAKRFWTPDGAWFQDHAKRLLEEVRHKKYSLLRSKMGEPHPSLRGKKNAKYLMRSFIGHFGFVRKKLFKSVDGFPTQFTGYGLEDDAMSFLCYMNSAKFQNLRSIEVIHVSHELSAVQFDQLKLNEDIYCELLKRYGVKEFHIGSLLYPENRSYQYIISKI